MRLTAGNPLFRSSVDSMWMLGVGFALMQFLTWLSEAIEHVILVIYDD